MSTTGFIGTGHIAAPMARFLAGKGHKIHVTRRNETVSAALARDIGATIATPQAVLDASDTVVLCLRPHVATEVLSPLKFRPDHAIVSVMAGITTESLAALCTPAQRLVQTIPLGFLEQGGCPLVALGDDTLLADLFSPENPVVKVDGEDELNAHFAICAMVPGMADLVLTGSDWLSRHTGNRDKAAFYTAQLLTGFLTAIDKTTPESIAAERDALATPQTLSLKMVETLRDTGAHDSLRQGLAAVGTMLDLKES